MKKEAEEEKEIGMTTLNTRRMAKRNGKLAKPMTKEGTATNVNEHAINDIMTVMRSQRASNLTLSILLREPQPPCSVTDIHPCLQVANSHQQMHHKG